MQKIERYPISLTEANLGGEVILFQLPAGARILDAVPRATEIGVSIYAIVDTEAEAEARPLAILATRAELPSGITAEDYVATFRVGGGSGIHVFVGQPITVPDAMPEESVEA